MQFRRKQKMKNTPFRLSKPAKHNDQKNRKNAAAQGNGTKSDAAPPAFSFSPAILFSGHSSSPNLMKRPIKSSAAKEQSPDGGRLKHADMTSGIRRRSLFTL